MSDSLITALVSIVLAIVGLAALATLLSPNARTSQVIGAGAQGLAADIGAATGPVTGNSLTGGFGGGFMAPAFGNGV